MNKLSGGKSGVVAPLIDRNRCEGKADCIRVCPYAVFEIEKIGKAEKAMMSLKGRVKTWVHGGKQAFVINPLDCHVCQLCIDACPEQAIKLVPLAELA